jgi:ATP-dependent helicase/nuclease subunit A
LYVGMTRAKELLVLSGGVTARANGETVLALLEEAGEGAIGEPSTEAVVIGSSAIPHHVSPAPGRAPARRKAEEPPAAARLDADALIALWERRTASWTEARGTPRHLTPTLMGKTSAAPAGRSLHERGADAARLTGILAHHILEDWDFAAEPAEMSERVEAAVAAYLDPAERTVAGPIASALKELLSGFGRSDWYLRLRRAEILGREIPFLMPWGEEQVMEGVIDLLYRLDGELWIADYKTDAVTGQEAAGRAERYREQGRAYKAAVGASLGEPVRFHCLFLRCATAVEL